MTEIPVIDDLKETTSSFREKILQAHAMQSPFIETTKEMIKHLMPHGRGNPDPGYFYYEGIRIYEHGTREKIEEHEQLQTHQLLHGDKGRLEGRN